MPPFPQNNLRPHCNTHVYIRRNKIGLTVHSFTYSISYSCLEGVVYFCVSSSACPGCNPSWWFLQVFACSCYTGGLKLISLCRTSEEQPSTQNVEIWLLQILSPPDNWDWICWSHSVISAYTLLRCICLLQPFPVRLASWPIQWLMGFYGLGVSCCFIHPFNKTNKAHYLGC